MLFTRLKAYQYVKPVKYTTYGVFSSNSEHGILLVWILKEPTTRLENPSALVSCYDYKLTDLQGNNYFTTNEFTLKILLQAWNMWDGFWLLTYTKKKKHFKAEQDPMYFLAQFMSAAI